MGGERTPQQFPNAIHFKLLLVTQYRMCFNSSSRISPWVRSESWLFGCFVAVIARMPRSAWHVMSALFLEQFAHHHAFYIFPVLVKLEEPAHELRPCVVHTMMNPSHAWLSDLAADSMLITSYAQPERETLHSRPKLRDVAPIPINPATRTFAYRTWRADAGWRTQDSIHARW